MKYTDKAGIMSKEDAISIDELYGKYSLESACEQELFRQRWPSGWRCPVCGHSEYLTISTRRMPLYECRKCRRQTTLTAGTIFDKTRTPLRKWFVAIRALAVSKTGYSAAQLSRDINVTYATAWTMSRKIRKAMGDRESSRILSGAVQADESYAGGPDEGGKRGRGTGKTKVFGVVEVAEGKDGKTHPASLRLSVVEAINSEVVCEKISEWVKKGSTVYTDKLNVYASLEGYTHIAHKSGKNADKHGHLGWYHVMIGNLQNLVRGAHHGLESKHLQRYLDEYCFRFNRKGSMPGIFSSLLRQCVRSVPVIYAELIG